MQALAYLFFLLIVTLLAYLHHLLVDLTPKFTNHVAPTITRITLQNNLFTGETEPYDIIQPNNKCKDLLRTLTEGQWFLRHNATYEDFRHYQERDLQMRLRKGWPAYLYHGDLRCGTRYPLPRLIKVNKSEGSYLDIASQCDAMSLTPCCRDDIGWCGKGEIFCTCPKCIDFRNYIPAEIADWTPFNNCQIKLFNQVSTCKLLNSAFTSITFIGDSLVRHLFTAFLILLNNDDQCGGLRRNLSPTEKVYCQGENQFTDSACHTKLAMNWTDIKDNTQYCTTLTNQNKPILSFVEAFSCQYAQMAANAVKSRMMEVRPLILIGIGVHDNYDYNKVIRTFINPIITLRDTSVNSNPVVIWLNAHSTGPLKPIEFQLLQSNAKLKEYNSILGRYCERHRIAVFDTYNITEGIHSFDGTHHGYEVNRLKAQILLNGLAEIIKFQ